MVQYLEIKVTLLRKPIILHDNDMRSHWSPEIGLYACMRHIYTTLGHYTIQSLFARPGMLPETKYFFLALESCGDRIKRDYV